LDVLRALKESEIKGYLARQRLKETRHLEIQLEAIEREIKRLFGLYPKFRHILNDIHEQLDKSESKGKRYIHIIDTEFQKKYNISAEEFKSEFEHALLCMEF